MLFHEFVCLRREELVDGGMRTVQRAQGLPIAIVEEIAYENGWISKEELLESAERYGKSPYGKHLKDVAEGKVVIVPND